MRPQGKCEQEPRGRGYHRVVEAPEPPPLDQTEIPDELPGLRLLSTVVFPFDVVSVQIDRPRSLRMIDDIQGDAALVACFFPRDRDEETASRSPTSIRSASSAG